MPGSGVFGGKLKNTGLFLLSFEDKTNSRLTRSVNFLEAFPCSQQTEDRGEGKALGEGLS